MDRDSERNINKIKEPAIRFVGVNKRFKFNADNNNSVLEIIVSAFSRSGNAVKQDHALWALQEMTFDIAPGECVGLVGNNGSGKSTLLKVASGIIRPTSGRVEIRGRLSALLELGAGFHPDLTGKENIWLNASILGLSNVDIARVYDDIVEFSELGEFIHMPVKHYSSGMYMRLGFSVAVHVRPDVLLIDEILAVGDQSFQIKCIARLHQLNDQGVTVIFVSHNLETVRSLCSRIFWIVDGEMVTDGDTDDVIKLYLASHDITIEKESDEKTEAIRRWGTAEVKITSLRLLSDSGHEQDHFIVGESMTVEMQYLAQRDVKKAEFGLSFFREDGAFVGAPNRQVAETESAVTEGSGTVRCHIEQLPLLPAVYDITATVYDAAGNIAYDHFEQAKSFRVSNDPEDEADSQIEISASWDSVETALQGETGKRPRASRNQESEQSPSRIVAKQSQDPGL
jgi:lipopolysaccharide transport system ATP-binding protein